MTLTADSFRTRVADALADARGALDRFLALPEGAPVEDAVAAFDGIGRALDPVVGPAEVYAAAHPDDSVRKAAEEGLQQVAAFTTELSLHRGAYDALAAVEPGEATGPVERRFVEHALRDFRRAGVDRDATTRERIREIQQELVLVGQEFDRNIVQGGGEVRVADGHAGLAGLPADFLASHPEGEDGAVVLSTDPTDFAPVMLFAESDDLRRRMLLAFQTRAVPENLPVLDRLLALRHELARLLGFDTWAAWACDDKMVRSAADARAFVTDVARRARPQAEREYAELLEERRRDRPDAERVEVWEYRHLTERLKRRKFEFDAQEVRPYFPYAQVLDGVLRTTEALYGVTIRPVESGKAWHPDVAVYDVVEEGVVVARFYLDMFPRNGKYKHAAMFHWRSGVEGSVRPEAALLCNFTRPTDDDPALLLHEEVTTLFHEFGHLLHHLFAVQPYHSMAGISCDWDFVEVPSQLYEEWAWNVHVLQSFARHHETGEPIPAELVERLRAAEEYGKGLMVTGQMFYALLSLTLYELPPDDLDTTEVVERLQREVTLFRRMPDTFMQASFGHLNGYGPLYYCYMWSHVIAKDLWGAFEADPMSRSVAGRYRSEVLARGGSRDAADLVRSFLGRDYGLEAWERWLRA